VKDDRLLEEGGDTVRKYLYLMVFALIMLFPMTEVSAKDLTTNSNVSAKTYEISSAEEDILDLGVIKITAGLTKEQEVTFDKVRNIAGEAKEGTVLVFKVYQDKEQEDKETYSQSVGASGLFSQLINLKVGKNYIEIKVEQENNEQVFLFEISRKKEEIKKELEEVKINNIFSEQETTKNTVLKSILK
jgi:hypothetical protein